MKEMESSISVKLFHNKHKYYSLCKQIRGIQSRVFHLEAADSIQKRKLELFQQKKQSLEKIKNMKKERQIMKLHASNLLNQNIEENKNKNLQMKRQRSQLLNDIRSTIYVEKRTRYSQMKKESKINNQKIRRIKQKYYIEKKIKRDKIIEDEKNADIKVREFHKDKNQNMKTQFYNENMKFQQEIQQLQRKALKLQNKQKSLIQSVRNSCKLNTQLENKFNLSCTTSKFR